MLTTTTTTGAQTKDYIQSLAKIHLFVLYYIFMLLVAFMFIYVCSNSQWLQLETLNLATCKKEALFFE